MQKVPVVHVRVQWIMEHQNIPACTKTISLLQVLNLKMDTMYTEEEEEEEEENK